MPALAFRMMYPRSCISFYADVGQGHFDVSDKLVQYLLLFLKKAAQRRLPQPQPMDKYPELISVNPTQGWLAQRWQPAQKQRAKAAPHTAYKGDAHDAFWYFDEEIAMETEARYAAHRAKKERYIGFIQDNEMLKFDPKLHAGMQGSFRPKEDGITFRLRAVFTDSLRSSPSGEHAAAPLHIRRICGPVAKLDDSTFRLRFYRMGMHNARRTNELWLLAENGGDKQYNSSVQQLCIRIPYRNTEGRRQAILFPSLDNVKLGSEPPPLRATSDCGLPVSYYVKEGAAEVVDQKIVFTKIPPRSKFPLKVTVAAWQYGLAGSVQTAEPVERSFYIVNE